MEKSKILIVDDEDMQRDMLFKRLFSKGYELICLRSGEECIAYLESNAVDLVLLDIMMPEMSGVEVLVQIRANYTQNELPIIMVFLKTNLKDIGFT